MKTSQIELKIGLKHHPRVLLFGNGMLKLGNKGKNWNDLLKEIKTLPGEIDPEGIPNAMQPEAFCGVDVEGVQRSTADKIQSVDPVHPLVDELLSIPFDAILTTNYTYEIENVLSGKKWNENRRKKCFCAFCYEILP